MTRRHCVGRSALRWCGPLLSRWNTASGSSARPPVTNPLRRKTALQDSFRVCETSLVRRCVMSSSEMRLFEARSFLRTEVKGEMGKASGPHVLSFTPFSLVVGQFEISLAPHFISSAVISYALTLGYFIERFQRSGRSLPLAVLPKPLLTRGLLPRTTEPLQSHSQCSSRAACD